MLYLLMHSLLDYWLRAARGTFPPVDGGVSVVAPLARGLEASVAFTGHAVVATALSASDVKGRGVDGYGGSLAPDFLRWLAGGAGWIGVLDVTLVAAGRGGGAALPLRRDLDAHPRVQIARSLRSEVEVYADDRGLVTLSNGVAGRREVSIEASEAGRGCGTGRSLLMDLLASIPRGEPVFAAVSPGNARSLRMFLGCGFVPIGSEVILRPSRDSASVSVRPAPYPA